MFRLPRDQVQIGISTLATSYQKLGENDSLHAFYAFQKDVRTEPNLQGNTLPGWGDHPRNAHRQIGTLQYVHIFSPSVTNEARLGFNRIAIAVQSLRT